MMYRIVQNFGDTYNGARFQIRRNGAILPLTGALIEMFITSTDGRKSKTLFPGSGLAITDDANGWFEISEQVLPLDVGKYTFFIRLTIGEWRKSYIRGQIIIKDPKDE